MLKTWKKRYQTPHELASAITAEMRTLFASNIFPGFISNRTLNRNMNTTLAHAK